MKINIEEFDLNVDYRLSFREKCKLERKEYEEKVHSDINKFKMETENIIKEKWDTLFIKPKSIYVRMIYLNHKKQLILNLILVFKKCI